MVTSGKMQICNMPKMFPKLKRLRCLTCQAIADASGVSEKTIRNSVSENSETQPTAITGKDGKQYQLFPDLTQDEYRALKDDIRQRGVLVPVEIDDSGNILDGHHRIKAWNELKAEGVSLPDYVKIIRKFENESEKRNHVRALNILRRHLSKEQVHDQWQAMRQDGMTYQAIADASGVSKATVWESVVQNQTTEPPTITGKDGKQYPPTKKPPSAPQETVFEMAGMQTVKDDARNSTLSNEQAELPERTIGADDARNSTLPNGKAELPERVIGVDGKSYPATKYIPIS